jgi:hypothetical protein
MEKLTQEEKQLLKNQLLIALKKQGNGQISDEIILNMVHTLVGNIDKKNSALMHKGTDWLAKELLKEKKNA